jgi:hypothetical protein
VGDASKKSEKEEIEGKSTVVNGTRIYNGIELKTNEIRLSKAYLVFKDSGERVPNDNSVDFREAVKLILLIDSGWVAKEGRSSLGAAEMIINEEGEVILDEKDLFSSQIEGVSEKDAKMIGLTASIILPGGTPPTSFTIKFRVWDKMGAGSIEGSYKLFSK